MISPSFAQPLSSSVRLKTLYEKTQKLAHSKERLDGRKFFKYKHNRTEDGHRRMSIAELQHYSPIKKLIPELIEREREKQEGRKVRILDLGAGSCAYTDQIRSTFPDDVKVYSTGLSKSVAKHTRKNRLHQNDLKWISIEQMKDFEEFDLILSSFGEIYYGSKSGPFNRWRYGFDEDPLTMKLQAIFKKLRPGGIASLAPMDFKKDFVDDVKEVLIKLIKESGMPLRYRFFNVDHGKNLVIQKAPYLIPWG